MGWKWPGNIRELENFIERAVILTRGNVLHVPLAELAIADSEVFSEVDPNLQAAEREHILRVLRETRGMIGGPGGAAERLGLKRTTLNSKLKEAWHRAQRLYVVSTTKYRLRHFVTQSLRSNKFPQQNLL